MAQKQKAHKDDRLIIVCYLIVLLIVGLLSRTYLNFDYLYKPVIILSVTLLAILAYRYAFKGK